MKLKDFFSRQKKQAKLGGEAFDQFIESIGDADMPDVVAALLEENFMTKERAASDKEITAKIRAEVYNGVDASILDLIAGLPKSEQDLINAETNTNRKLKLLDASYKKQYDDLKKTAPDSAQVNTEHLKTIRELTERVEAEKTQREKVEKAQAKAVKDITDQKDKEIKAFKVRTDLMGKLGQLEFAKEYSESPKIKNMVYNDVISSIMKNDIDYTEDGQLVVQVIENGVAKPKYFDNTNDLVTVDKLIEQETKDYIKRNNGEPKPDNTNPRVLPPAQPKQGLTLRQIQAAAALQE